MPRHVPQRSQYAQKKESLAQKVVDKIGGVSRIDNGTDPTSALSMARRKAASRAPKINITPGRNSSGQGVGM